jgi:3-isopropylmalate/(R)-2-methylmalate dehydratase large subunit
MNRQRTIFEKIWDSHTIISDPSGYSLLYVDWLLCSESSFHEFEVLEDRQLSVHRPERVLCISDHYTPSRGTNLSDFADDERRNIVALLRTNAQKHGITMFGIGDNRRGIQHLVGPEQGMAQPGVILLCNDSHTSTQGALGAIAFGIGGEVSHVLATQTLWQRKPRQMRITITGNRGYGVAAKDIILDIIAKIGADGAVQHAIEYAGNVIDEMSVEERMTVCNMSIEAGARAGIIAPDDKTVTYLKGRPYAPKDGAQWETAVAYWKSLPSDENAAWDRQKEIDISRVEPMVTWGNSPEDAVPISGVVPDPANEPDSRRRARIADSLMYMALQPGMRITDILVDQVFIGSCTNSRIEDLRAAAAVAHGRRAVVPALVVPGSTSVKLQAEAEGLDRIFKEAGFTWGHAGCSMCVSLNGDTVAPGKRCASTSNRNFRGRQGRDSRTHLVSPAMAAAAAIKGRFTDVRQMMA